MKYLNSKLGNVHFVMRLLNVSNIENVHISFVSGVSITIGNVLYLSVVNNFVFSNKNDRGRKQTPVGTL